MEICEDAYLTPQEFLLQMPRVLAWRPGSESQGRRAVED